MDNSFYNDILELINKSDEMNENEKDEENSKICLISHKPLKDDYITLECKHKFNYEYIYNELKNQKITYNKYETQQLRIHQLKCPYCRNIQNKILPYLENKNDIFPKVYGVNYPNKHCMLVNECEYVFKIGKRKGQRCLKDCHTKMCNFHSKNKIIKNYNTCSAVLKSGKRKGDKCSYKASINSIFCLKHKSKKKDII